MVSPNPRAELCLPSMAAVNVYQELKDRCLVWEGEFERRANALDSENAGVWLVDWIEIVKCKT